MSRSLSWLQEGGSETCLVSQSFCDSSQWGAGFFEKGQTMKKISTLLGYSLAFVLPAFVEAANFNVAAPLGVGVVYGPQGLVAAITAANSNLESNKIVLEPGGRYRLDRIDNIHPTDGPNGLPRITGAITISTGTDGPSSPAIIERAPGSGINDFRIFHVSSGTLALINVVVTGGQGVVAGGGLFNRGRIIVLVNSEVSGNKASRGGGIFNSGIRPSVVVLEGSTVSKNNADSSSGGIHNEGTLIITD